MPSTKLDRRKAMYTMVGASAAAALGLTPDIAQAGSRKSDSYTALGKAIVDKEFRAQIFSNPERACKNAGLSPTDRVITKIQGLNEEKFTAAVEQVGDFFSGW